MRNVEIRCPGHSTPELSASSSVIGFSILFSQISISRFNFELYTMNFHINTKHFLVLSNKEHERCGTLVDFSPNKKDVQQTHLLVHKERDHGRTTVLFLPLIITLVSISVLQSWDHHICNVRGNASPSQPQHCHIWTQMRGDATKNINKGLTL